MRPSSPFRVARAPMRRLVLAMLASSLFLGSALLLSREVPPLLFPVNTYLGLHRLSIMGLVGSFTSIMIGFRLLLAIAKSGSLDRRSG